MTVSPAEDQVGVPETDGREPPASAAGGFFKALLFKEWPKRRRLLALSGVGVLLAFLLYYPVGAWRVHVIDDDPSFASAESPQGQSRAVTAAAALIHREIDQHGWTPNRPLFMPAAILVAMPNFQKGITAMIGCFAIGMDQRIGRLAKEGGAVADDDLARAATLLQYPPDVWMINPREPWARTLSSEKQYRNAGRSFEAYNRRLADGLATFDRRPDVLGAVLLRFAKELEATADRLDAPIGDASGWFGGAADGLYYDGKGRAYAALLLLRGLGEDAADVLTARGLTEAWTAMLGSLAAAATPRPWVVLDGGSASMLVPNHLAVQGYHLLRARSRLSELAEALR
ncbi:MAG TPA: DUF2333 domain-containing protein [Telmatospirillum sp.]|nr:DUF2333 domain-containing protein [Telmatospirillum sp.]